MSKVLPLVVALIMGILIPCVAKTQSNSVTGSVRSATTNEPLPAVSVVIENSTEGTYTDPKGMFELNTNLKYPLRISISAVGYETVQLDVSGNQRLEVLLKPVVALGQDVVISANRVPSRLMESPVSIERLGNVALRNTAQANYYDAIANLKGVDMIAASLLFKTPTTRGFSQSGNPRFNQFVAGMDNQAPGLNFAVGSIIGLSELDVESVELLQGASSALYGSGGMNGTLIVTGKSPFKYQGLSFQIKEGIMGLVDPTPYHHANVRWADKVSSRFAYKIGVELIHADDWKGTDYRNYKRFGSTGQIINGTRDTDPNYDGINVYGDETTANLRDVLNAIGQQAPFLQGFISTLPADIPVSRTGYRENEVVNPITYNLKLSGAIHYQLTKSIEANLTGFWGTGNTIYTGATRFSLQGMKIGQYKAELNHKNWFLRGYTTQENAGGAHNMTVNTQLANEAWKPSGGGNGWYAQYGQAYLTQKLLGKTDRDAHNAARAFADIGRPAPRSDQFKRIYDSIRQKPIPLGGKLLDRSDLWVVEGQYNLTDIVKFAEVLVGANWKQYVLNSQGTLFADKVGEPIHTNEYGGYVQIAKDIANFLRLTASGRFDKNQNFEGRFTPRITALVKVAKDHNIRLSYQTAYRFPTNQQQWIDLNVGSGILIGGVKQLWDKYDMTNNPVYAAASITTPNPQVVSFTEVKPESVASYEMGYKSLIANKLLVDAYVYFTEYQNFLSRRDVVQLKNPQGGFTSTNIQGYSIVTNAPGTVKAYGWGLSLDYVLPGNFVIKGNISSDRLQDVPDGFRADFNSPKYRTNLGISNAGFGTNEMLGFALMWRWQDGFYYQSDFAFGDLPPISVVDAQFSYKLGKSIFKVGANNLLNSYYRNGVGNATIGGMYYVSYGFNIY